MVEVGPVSGLCGRFACMIVLAVPHCGGFLPLSGLWTGLNLSVWVWAGPVFVPTPPPPRVIHLINMGIKYACAHNKTD